MPYKVYQVGFKGLRTHESYDDIASAIDSPKDKLTYPTRRTAFAPKHPQLSVRLYGSSLDVEQRQENMTQYLTRITTKHRPANTETENAHER